MSEGAALDAGAGLTGADALAQLGRDSAGLLIGRTHHDQFVELFNGPALLREFDRQPIEQLRMARQFALETKVFESAHKASPEECLPMAIHRDACGERILSRNQPSSQSQSVLWCSLGQCMKSRRRGGGDFVLGFIVLAAEKNVRSRF